jgi:hypothetical protein
MRELHQGNGVRRQRGQAIADSDGLGSFGRCALGSFGQTALGSFRRNAFGSYWQVAVGSFCDMILGSFGHRLYEQREVDDVVRELCPDG